MFRQVLAIATVVSAVGAALFPRLASTNDLSVRPSATVHGVEVWNIGDITTGSQGVPLFPAAADRMREGFVRVINRSDRGGEVTVVAIDDAGWRSPEINLMIDAAETVHFNSDDLEQGNVDKGLSGGAGAPGTGDWRLELTSDLHLEVLAYIRTTDGFLTAMHDVVERGLTGNRVAIFNPGRNKNQESLLRLINPGSEDLEVTISLHGRTA